MSERTKKILGLLNISKKKLSETASEKITESPERETLLPGMTPWDWQQMVRLCGSKKKLNMVNMEVSDFKDFKQLYEGKAAPYVTNKKSENGTDFLISNTVHLQVRRDSPGVLFYKTNFDEETFLEVNLNRKTRRTNNIPVGISAIRDRPKPTSTKKYTHLQKLLQWVPTRFHEFYKNLPHGNNESED